MSEGDGDTRDRRSYLNVLQVVAVAAGVFVPEFGAHLEPLVVFLVYSSLRGLRIDEVEFGSYALLILLSIGISYVLLPCGAGYVSRTRS